MGVSWEYCFNKTLYNLQAEIIVAICMLDNNITVRALNIPRSLKICFLLTFSHRQL